MDAAMRKQFAFVPTDHTGKPKIADRALIRSHAMQGKNKREGSRRSIREAKKAIQQSVHPRLGPPPPTDLALMKLPEDVDNHSQQLLTKFFTYSTIKTIAYPIELCVDFHQPEIDYFNWILRDAAFLHSVLLTTSAVQDCLLQRPPAIATYTHLRRTLSLLNEKLSDEETHLMDSTVYIVINLILMAGILGDLPAARAHILGLRQIVRLRGGFDSLRCNPKMHFKLDRLELSQCLDSGDSSCIFSNVFSSSAFTRPLSVRDTAFNCRFVHTIVEPRVIVVFEDLQHLVGLINDIFDMGSRLDGAIFQEAMSSIQSRLLHLNEDLENTAEECLRLGMLAFMTTTFHLPGRRASYGNLADRFRYSCQKIALSLKYNDLNLWLLMLGAISVFDVNELWLREWWCGISSPGILWEEARWRLQSVMWINCIHDDLGSKVFDQLTNRAHVRSK